MTRHEATTRHHDPKRPAGAHRPASNPPARALRCPGAAAQLAAVHRTLRRGPGLPLAREGAPGPAAHAPRVANRTGLPDRLKAGIENLSGISLDDVKVHYGSPKPAQLRALAYTEGADIHVGPGQERHLAHEAWHVVQQKQGRVRPTLQLLGIQLNDDPALEREADRFGSLGAAGTAPAAITVQRKQAAAAVVQRATVADSGYTVSVSDDFTKNHMRSSKASALSRSKKRKLAKSTIINDKSADVKKTVEGSDYALWKVFGNDERYYQSFDLAHWVTTFADGKYTVTDEQTGGVWLGAYFNNNKGVKTTNVTHLWG